ncbi:hypothetical protein ACGFY3_50705 [Streptomyces mirabilis]|uniref:hypothetical protein n=1 Tax=Streptomyces mirabilis TaxID=68239 RepID=UPI00371F6F10
MGLTPRHLDQGAVGEGDAGGLPLSAVNAVHATLAAVGADGVQALAAVGQVLSAYVGAVVVMSATLSLVCRGGAVTRAGGRDDP